MTTIGVTAAILGSILGAFLMYRINPNVVEWIITQAEKGRAVIGIVIIALAAWHFIRSGNPFLVAIAALGFAFLTAWLLVERPWQETI